MRVSDRWVSLFVMPLAAWLAIGCPEEPGGPEEPAAGDGATAAPAAQKAQEEPPIPSTLPDVDDPDALIAAAERETEDIAESLEDLVGRVEDLGRQAEAEVEPAVQEVRSSLTAMERMIESSREAGLTEAREVRRRLDEGLEALQRRWRAALRAYEEAASPSGSDR